jgi:hypothetical protein
VGLKYGDLKDTIQSLISIDEFQPKAGSEENVIVVAFYFNDKEPAQDLNTFIQRGFIDTLDVEVSPNTDEDGRYLVFVEMDRSIDFPQKFNALVKDVENLTGKLDWRIKPYLSDADFPFGDPQIFKNVILVSNAYQSKEEFKMSNMNENINEFFKSSMLTGLTITENTVILLHNRSKIVAEVIDVGDYDTVIGRNALAESAFNLGQKSFEAKVLSSMLGNYDVFPIDKFLLLTRGEQVMLVKNTYVSHER